MCLLGSDCAYLSPLRVLEQAAAAPHSAWNLVQVPCDYVANAWPLRAGVYRAIRAHGSPILVLCSGLGVGNAVCGGHERPGALQFEESEMAPLWKRNAGIGPNKITAILPTMQ